MAFQKLFLALLATFFILPLGQTQLITTTPTPTFSATVTVAIPEQSFYTDPVQIVSTITSLETIGGSTIAAVSTQTVYGGIQATDVSLVQAYSVSNIGDHDYALCWFPTSGNWARLPRIIFYGTIVFALLARAHEWLVAGALAASLTFSGVAAIQMSLQVWTHQMIGELDFFALLGILSTSCIIAMPLLNWSSTIRYLGQSDHEKKAREERDKQMQDRRATLRAVGNGMYEAVSAENHPKAKHENYGPTRTVIVFWAILVTIGFLSGFVALVSMQYKDADWTSLLVESGADSIRCVPDNGTLDLSAGQFQHWSSFWMTAEFISINHCENPCTALPDGYWTLFRSPANDLATLTARQIDNILYQSAISRREARSLEFASFYYAYMLIGFPFFLIQGFLHFFLFRKHTPQDARQRIYVLIVGEKNPDAASPLVKGIALTLSLMSYFFAVLVLLITPFALVLNVCATELIMWIFPQSEDNKHVGQWSVAAGTLLVLLAALLCRHDAGAWYFFRETQGAIKKTFSRWHRCCRQRKPSAYRKQSDTEYDPSDLQPTTSFRTKRAFFEILVGILAAIGNIVVDLFNYMAWSVQDFIGLFVHEWMLFKLFWKDPATVPQPSLVYRDKPPMPQSKRTRAKVYRDNEPLEELPMEHVARYQLREEYPMKGMSAEAMKTFSIVSETQPVSIQEIERPLLTQAHSSGSNVAVRSTRSQALSKQGSENYIPTRSAPQSPLLSPPMHQQQQQQQQQHQLYSPVPSQAASSPFLNMDSKPTTPQTHLFPNTSPNPKSDPVTVMSSLTNSIAARSRRSDVYSPVPEQMQQLQRSPPTPHPPSPSQPHLHENIYYHEADSVPIPMPVQQQPNLPPLSTRASNLFSEDEMAQLYKDGTPVVRSMMPSRNSIVTAPLHPGLTAEARGIAGTGRVSYLQIQSGRDPSEADAWGDELVLRRDRYGRWVVMDAPNAPD